MAIWINCLRNLSFDKWMSNEGGKHSWMSAYAPLTTAAAIVYITISIKNILIVKGKEKAAGLKRYVLELQRVQYELERMRNQKMMPVNYLPNTIVIY